MVAWEASNSYGHTRVASCAVVPGVIIRVHDMHDNTNR